MKLNFPIPILILFLSQIGMGQDMVWLKKRDFKKIKKESRIINSDQIVNLPGEIYNSTILGLGESSHGAKEIYDVKCELIKHFIVEKKYKILLFEAPYSEIFTLNEFINSRISLSEDSILIHFVYWPWMTKEVKELVLWMKDYNDRSVEKVEIFGIDIASYKGSLTRLKDFSRLLEIEESLLDVDSLKEELNHITKARYSKNYYKLKDYDKRSLYEKLVKLKGSIINKSKGKLADEQVRNIEEEFNFLKGYVENIFRENYLLRDQLMSENVIRKYEQEKKKMLLWAHDNHLDKDSKASRMGSYLLERFEEKYTNISITFESGNYRAVDKHSPSLNQIQEAVMNPYNSIEYLSSMIREDHEGGILLDTKKITHINGRIRNYLSDIEMRMIGAVKKADEFTNYNLINSFDFVLCLNKSTPTEILK